MKDAARSAGNRGEVGVGMAMRILGGRAVGHRASGVGAETTILAGGPEAGPAGGVRVRGGVHFPLGVVLTLVMAGVPACETMKGLADRVTPSPAATGDMAGFRSEPDIRVRIVRGAAEKEISGPARLLVRSASAGSTVDAKIVPSPVTVTSGAKGVRVVDGKGGVTEWGFGAEVEIMPAGSPEASAADGALAGASESMKLDGKRFVGFLTIRPAWGEAPERFDVVATMGVESYLPGVLTHELFKDWPRQTYEAQAVASRTYALHERERARRQGRAVDVESTTDDQVFGGVAGSPVADEAARATRGTVLTEDGRLLRAYFSSQCGGRPASAAEVWPTSVGYEFNKAGPLQAKERPSACARSTLHRWETTRNDDDVNRRLRAWGRQFKHEVAGITKLRGVEVESRNEADRPSRYRLTDADGRKYSMTAEEFRMACNTAGANLEPITRTNRVHSGDVEVEVWADQVHFRGRGWGHGVGMCQWCAKGMADAGRDWRGMLETFYPGAEVKKVY